MKTPHQHKHTPATGAASALPVPPADEWPRATAWIAAPGGEVAPVGPGAPTCPDHALFVSGEFHVTLAESIGPGMTRQTERALPGLIRLDQGTPIEAYVAGFDGKCWTWRRGKRGRRAVWILLAAEVWPAPAGAAPPNLSPIAIEQVIIQSRAPMQTARKHICLAIRHDATAENLSRAADPDPGDE